MGYPEEKRPDPLQTPAGKRGLQAEDDAHVLWQVFAYQVKNPTQLVATEYLDQQAARLGLSPQQIRATLHEPEFPAIHHRALTQGLLFNQARLEEQAQQQIANNQVVADAHTLRKSTQRRSGNPPALSAAEKARVKDLTWKPTKPFHRQTRAEMAANPAWILAVDAYALRAAGQPDILPSTLAIDILNGTAPKNLPDGKPLQNPFPSTYDLIRYVQTKFPWALERAMNTTPPPPDYNEPNPFDPGPANPDQAIFQLPLPSFLAMTTPDQPNRVVTRCGCQMPTHTSRQK